MNNYVFIIDTNKQPLKPTTPKRARELLNKGKAAVFRRYPFTLILKQEYQPKGSQSIDKFLSEQPEILKKIKSHGKKPLADAAAVNSTRNQIFEMASKTGLLIQAGSGALAKLVRAKSNLPKAHWIDAAANSINEQPIKF